MIQVPLQRRGHGHQPGRAQHARFFRQRIREPRGLHARGARNNASRSSRHMRDGQDFAIPETDQALANLRLRLVIGQAQSALARNWKTRREFVQAINARDLFDQIDFALDFRAPGRLRAFPRRQQRSVRATILVHAHGRKSQRAETRLDFFVRNVGAHHPQKFRARQHRSFSARAYRDKHRQPRTATRRRQVARSAPRRGARPARPFPDRRRGQTAWTLPCAISKSAWRGEPRWD